MRVGEAGWRDLQRPAAGWSPAAYSVVRSKTGRPAQKLAASRFAGFESRPVTKVLPAFQPGHPASFLAGDRRAGGSGPRASADRNLRQSRCLQLWRGWVDRAAAVVQTHGRRRIEPAHQRKTWRSIVRAHPGVSCLTISTRFILTPNDSTRHRQALPGSPHSLSPPLIASCAATHRSTPTSMGGSRPPRVTPASPS